jgi:hypothetical protein
MTDVASPLNPEPTEVITPLEIEMSAFLPSGNEAPLIK